MKRAKRILALGLALLLTVFCGAGSARAEEKKISVVTTIFPIYDWVREIAGDSDGVDLTLLISRGTDMHSYQMTVQDMIRVSSADVFTYVGGESDSWARDALREAANPNIKALSLMDALGADVREEEQIEGMQGEAEEDKSADEHVWLSLRNARKLTARIAEVLGEADPSRAEEYRTRAAAYGEKLAALDAEYAETVEHAARRTLLFGDRFPFRYLTEDYGLEYYAAFPGCSAESEASFATIVFLAQKVDELKLPAIMTTENPQGRIAETVAENTKEKNQRILALDSMQGSAGDGDTYLDVMERNLAVLRDALNE